MDAFTRSCTYGALTNKQQHDLQKIQNASVRFIFNLKGKQKREAVTPYLKELHFLPVKYRIMFKTAMMVFKCLNNIAPIYLIDLLKPKIITRYSSRSDDDFFLLEQPPPPRLTRTAAAFTHHGPRTWNALPPTIRCLTDIGLFKSALKTHYFLAAFMDPVNTFDIEDDLM